MASIIKASINLNEIPKDKIYVGKKGKYLPITITLNDFLDDYGNQGPVVVEQSKEEREAKEKTPILGNVKVFYTDSSSPDGTSQYGNQGKVKEVLQESNLLDDDIPF